MPTVELIVCKQCKRRFERNRRWQLFCTPVCRSHFHHEQNENLLRAARKLGLSHDPHSWESFTPKEEQ